MGHYREFLPPPELADDVERFWITSSRKLPPDSLAADGADPGPHLNRVLPDGCVDIIFDLQSGMASFVGTMTTALVVPSTTRDLLSVRFRPGAAARYLPMPVNAITDDAVPLCGVWSNGAEIAERMSDRNGDLHLQLAQFSQLLLNFRCSSDVAGPWQIAIRALRDAAHDDSIASIASRMGVSRQHLTRKFKQLVGVGPKEFGRVMRFRRLLADVRCRRSGGGAPPVEPVDWSMQAVRHGYFDQSHLSTEFKRLSGLTPGQYFGG